MSRIVHPNENVQLAAFTEPSLGGEDESTMGMRPTLRTSSDTLREAEGRAREMIAQAEADVARIHAEAEVAGNAAGEAEGRAEGLAAYSDAVATMHALIDALREDHERLTAEAAPQVVELALAIVRRLLGEYVDMHPEVIRHVVEEALTALTHRETVTIRVHPTLVPALEDHRASLQAVYGDAEIVVVGDAEISAGGCVLDTASAQVDATVAEVLERLRADLLPPGSDAPEPEA